MHSRAWLESDLSAQNDEEEGSKVLGRGYRNGSVDKSTYGSHTGPEGLVPHKALGDNPRTEPEADVTLCGNHAQA